MSWSGGTVAAFCEVQLPGGGGGGDSIDTARKEVSSTAASNASLFSVCLGA